VATEPLVLDVMEFPLERRTTLVECVEEMATLVGIDALMPLVETVPLQNDVCGVIPLRHVWMQLQQINIVRPKISNTAAARDSTSLLLPLQLLWELVLWQE